MDIMTFKKWTRDSHFDLYAYSNEDPERHMVRIEMGKVL